MPGPGGPGGGPGGGGRGGPGGGFGGPGGGYGGYGGRGGPGGPPPPRRGWGGGYRRGCCSGCLWTVVLMIGGTVGLIAAVVSLI